MPKLRFRRITVLVIPFLIFACTKPAGNPDDPREKIKEYISVSFGIQSVSDRTKLESMLTGEAKLRLASWSGDQFKRAFIDVKRDFPKLNFVEVKKSGENEASITYELSYTDKMKENEAKVTQKKLARMIRQNQIWYIESVRNIKELFEYKNELSLP